MRIVIQRVSRAAVTIRESVKSSIGQGFLILTGIEEADSSEDVDWLVRKVIGLRVFDDENGVMNRSIMDVGGEILVISQFTLFASYKKGNRPSWLRAPGMSILCRYTKNFAVNSPMLWAKRWERENSGPICRWICATTGR